MEVYPFSVEANFLESNKDSLTFICEAVEGAIDPPALEIQHNPSSNETLITIGALSPEDIEGNESTDEERAALASAYNISRENLALTRLESLQLLATTERTNLTGTKYEENKKLCNYGSATLRATYFELPDDYATIRLEKAVLYDVEEIGSVSHYEILSNYTLVQEVMSISLCRNMLSTVNRFVYPARDEAKQRLVDFFTEYDPNFVSEFVNLLYGKTSDEDEIDQKLLEIKGRFLGTSLEEEINPILAETRMHAVSGRENFRMHCLHFDLITPTPEDLLGLADLLKEI